MNVRELEAEDSGGVFTLPLTEAAMAAERNMEELLNDCGAIGVGISELPAGSGEYVLVAYLESTTSSAQVPPFFQNHGTGGGTMISVVSKTIGAPVLESLLKKKVQDEDLLQAIMEDRSPKIAVLITEQDTNGESSSAIGRILRKALGNDPTWNATSNAFTVVASPKQVRQIVCSGFEFIRSVRRWHRVQ